MGLMDRVITRLPEEGEVDNRLLDELIETAKDRICLILDEEELPFKFESICVDVVVKMYRKKFYEGISSEGIDSLNTTFVNNVLGEYSEEFRLYLDRKEKREEQDKKKVRFL